MTRPLPTPRLLLPLLGCLWVAESGAAAPIILYSTQFETAQGFDPAYDLAGQNDWVKSGTGGNGLTDWNAGLGYGQSAYIGDQPLTPDGLYLWKPINHNPTNLPIVTVTLDVSIVDSTTTKRDEFRWSVYNIAGVRLFSLIFDNRNLRIYHQLDDDAFVDDGREFINDSVYDVEIQMDFLANLWNVWLDGLQIITNEPITTTNAALTFGDADAVWLPDPQTGAGDNFMVFDNLTITADAPHATLDHPLPIGGGQYLLRVNGSEGYKYALEASTNLTAWSSLVTDSVGINGYFYYLDTTAVGLPLRFYRARWVPQ
jgi:hypothetical protein